MPKCQPGDFKFTVYKPLGNIQVVTSISVVQFLIIARKMILVFLAVGLGHLDKTPPGKTGSSKLCHFSGVTAEGTAAQ